MSGLATFAEQAAAAPQTLPPELLDALMEQYRRHIKGSFVEWCRHALAPVGQAPAAHHRLMGSALQDVAEGRCDRLMLLLPPGSAKSTYGSDLFPPWFMSKKFGLNVIAASHTATLAESFGRRARNRVMENHEVLGMALAGTGTAVGDWHTNNRGTYFSVGVGGSVTGRRADLIIVDDPIASRADAESQVIRDKTWDWFRADLTTRLKPGGRMVFIMTRWHPDDPAGRLLDVEGHRWRVLRLPAIADQPNDPLHRAIGQPLWPEWENIALLDQKREDVGEREWNSLYQQNPKLKGGGLFKIAMGGMVDAVPLGCRMVRGWDLAATEQFGTNNPDWTVGVLMCKTIDGRWIVADVVRIRGAPNEVEATIVATAQRDGPLVKISLPQDPGQAGKAQVQYLTSKLEKYSVSSSPESGDKATRADGFSSQFNVGNVSLVRGLWNAKYLAELEEFPAGTKDDQVDASSRAFMALSEPFAGPAKTAYKAHMQR